MIHIVVFADGFHHFEGAIQEYRKRTQAFITLHVLTPSRKKQPSDIIEDETIRLQKYLCDHKAIARLYKVYLDVGASMSTTREWYISQERVIAQHSGCVYVIGGAYGITDEAKKMLFSECRGLSPLTFPHAMALLVVFEQLYRLNEIKKGSKYHHADEV